MGVNYVISTSRTRDKHFEQSGSLLILRLPVKRCYYEVLGIERQADHATIKAAYRRLALKYHPDRNSEKDAEEKFKEASEAYEVLADAQKRATYDQFGHQGLNQQGFSGFSGTGDIFSHFSDIFEDFFGFGRSGSRGAQRRAPGQDTRYDLEITFMEAYQGIEKEIKIPKKETCLACEGQGYPKDVTPETCEHCQGTGQLYHSQGFFTISSTCGACRGQGKTVDKHCEECHGHGLTKTEKKLKVKIPAGVDDGMQLVLRGEGEVSSPGGYSGDLYVFLHVEKHPQFQREDQTIFIQQKISIPQAVLGAELEVETPEGQQSITIKAGAQTGDVIKIKGLGMPRVNHKNRGDFLVQLFIETPQKISKEQRELYEKLASLEGSSSQKSSKNPQKNSSKKKGKKSVFSYFS
ncbi:MAG: molecular chaperone DnaJ [Deltaproteobacteria bacterium]|nr:molecular chaperone DnaJ [Deltaproteobacteria bacterium]